MIPSLLASAALAAIEPLLVAYWVLAAGSVVVTMLPVQGVPQAFKDAVLLSASRGKLWQDRPGAGASEDNGSKKGRGRRTTTATATRSSTALPAWLRSLSVPQRWFLHFYVAGALANALTLGLMAFGLPATRKISAALAVADAEALTALALFQLHLVRRALETALLLEYPPGCRMHAIAYAFGMSYYLVVPLSLLPRGWSRRVVAEGWWSRAVATAAGGGSGGVADRVIAAARARGAAVAASLASSRAWRMHLAGILLFLAAMALQLASHAALARLSRRGAVAKGEAAAVATVAAARETPSLRARSRGRRGKEEEDQGDQEQEDRNKGGDSSSSPYALPRGPLFALVSCPHYSAEVLLYAALALLTRLRAQLPLLMLGWVAVNLALAARATHAWYARRFGEAYLGSRDAPWWRQRRALVPFFM